MVSVDVDECSMNTGHGPCEDVCRNTDGHFICDCSRPGYIINPADGLSCLGWYSTLMAILFHAFVIVVSLISADYVLWLQ